MEARNEQAQEQDGLQQCAAPRTDEDARAVEGGAALPALSGLLRGAGEAKAEVEQKDMHGNTALHLAVMLGRRECVQVEMNIVDTITYNVGLHSRFAQIQYKT